jgi:uncharacterized membrane protein YeaQ/YmgE (transglycosylase-associated protein family)
MEILAILLLVAALSLGFFVFSLSFSIFYNLALGLVVGALARLVLPGQENIGWFGTSLIGIAGSAIGGVLGNALGVGGVLELVLSVAGAAGLLSVFGFREKSRA